MLAADSTVDPLAIYLETSQQKCTRLMSLKREVSGREAFCRQGSTQSTLSIASISERVGNAIRESGAAIKETSVRSISHSKKKLSQGISCIRQLSEDKYWFGEETCTEARLAAKTYRLYHPTIEEEYDPRYPGAHLALPERKHKVQDRFVDETSSKPPSPVKSSDQKDFTEFAKIVYRRLKVYRGIYLFYSIITFMLGLPVMVTGFNKQFGKKRNDFDVLDCPHYLGITALLSCVISLWCALKNQIVLCVLTLITGVITVICAMIVLVTSALTLSGNIVPAEEQSHFNQQTHVVFIFSIGLLVASLAIVITSLSHLSTKKAKLTTSELKEEVRETTIAKVSVEVRNGDVDKLDVLSNKYQHRYSFASTISSLIKHELKDAKPEMKDKLKKTTSCPNSNLGLEVMTSPTSEVLDIITPDAPRTSTHSLPVSNEFNSAVVERWRKASFLARYHEQQQQQQSQNPVNNADGETNLVTPLNYQDFSCSDESFLEMAHESSV